MISRFERPLVSSRSKALIGELGIDEQLDDRVIPARARIGPLVGESELALRARQFEGAATVVRVVDALAGVGVSALDHAVIRW
jgi:hypothetical protein